MAAASPAPMSDTLALVIKQLQFFSQEIGTLKQQQTGDLAQAQARSDNQKAQIKGMEAQLSAHVADCEDRLEAIEATIATLPFATGSSSLSSSATPAKNGRAKAKKGAKQSSSRSDTSSSTPETAEDDGASSGGKSKKSKKSGSAGPEWFAAPGDYWKDNEGRKSK